MFGENYPLEYLPKREGEMETTLCDISNAQEKIGYKPAIVLKDYVKKWIKENHLE